MWPFFVVHLAFCLFILTCLQSQRSRLSSKVKWNFRWEYPPPGKFMVKVCSLASSLHVICERFCISLLCYLETKGALYVCFLKCFYSCCVSGTSLSIRYSELFFIYMAFLFKMQHYCISVLYRRHKAFEDGGAITVLSKDPGFYKPSLHRACGIVANKVQLHCT